MGIITLKHGTSVFELNKIVCESLGEEITVSFEPVVSSENVVVVCTLTTKDKKTKGFAYSYLMDKVDNYALKLDAYTDAVEVFGVEVYIAPEEPKKEEKPQEKETAKPKKEVAPTKDEEKKNFIDSLKITDGQKKELRKTVKKFKLNKKQLNDLTIGFAEEQEYEDISGISDITEKDIDDLIDYIYDNAESGGEDEE